MGGIEGLEGLEGLQGLEGLARLEGLEGLEGAPAAMLRRGHGNPKRSISVSSRRGARLRQGYGASAVARAKAPASGGWRAPAPVRKEGWKGGKEMWRRASALRSVALEFLCDHGADVRSSVRDGQRITGRASMDLS
jgi:hypothetical protein